MNIAARAIVEAPRTSLDLEYSTLLDVGDGELHELQLAAIRARFEMLRPHLRVLDQMAIDAGLSEISSLGDVVKLMFPHHVYKSYPVKWIGTGEFGKLTAWLAKLTTVPLAHIDCTGIRTIDEWVTLLDESTPLWVSHTSGTTGKLSLFPRTADEWRRGAHILGNSIRDWQGGNSGPNLLNCGMPLLHPGYEFGASTASRCVQSVLDCYVGDRTNAAFLYPGSRFSADVAMLSGRVSTAEGEGALESIVVPPHLSALRDDLQQRQARRPADLAQFFEEIQTRYAGRDVIIFGAWPILSDWAESGLARGLRGVFGNGSVLITGGGTKGRQLPPGWKERIFEFLGFDTCAESYAMTEMIPSAPRCEMGNYHFPAVMVPFVLDPDTGALAPRSGRKTGRLALFDLLAESYWGGVVTGDEVTVVWDEPCPCGKPGVHAEPGIVRFSEARGGTDKISCAAAPDAYDRALSFLTAAPRG
jgi:hypothetical protein